MLSRTVEQLELFVPDRFDMLRRRASSSLNSIVLPVPEGLDRIQQTHRDMSAAGRGALLLLRGDSGTGKSTFLNTLDLFLADVEVIAIPVGESIEGVLRSLPRTMHRLRVVVIEGRDALREIRVAQLESVVHEANGFLRADRGERTIVVWPCNADDLTERLVEVSRRVGGDALLGVRDPVYHFEGPPRETYIDIATRTVATLNQGAGLADLGVSQQRAEELAAEAQTIGHFMGLLRRDLLANTDQVRGLLQQTERCRLWVVVSAGNDPEGDVAGVTRGPHSAADIERLMRATDANVVAELKRYPEKLGILGAVLDARVLLLPSVAALAVAREFADERLSKAMTERGLQLARGATDETVARLAATDVGRALSGAGMGTRTRGGRPGSNTEEAFHKLADIASTNDALLNGAVARALEAGKLIEAFGLEQDLGSGLTRYTDIVAETNLYGRLRIEMMWRKKTGRAEIANYTLTKLFNYARAIGLL